VKKWVARPMDRRGKVVRPVSNSLQVRECVEEVSSPGGSPVATTGL
jgi:hypothetical protein